MARLEVCVDTLDGALAAIDGGADRIELCAALSEGGLTPSAGLMCAAARLTKPSYAMIRPRCGLFHFSEAEVEIMCADIAAARHAGLAGVVLGAQDSDGNLNLKVLQRLKTEAGDMGTTLHRVIDVLPDPLRALDQAIDLGFERVLTSGAKPFAMEGTPLIALMVDRAKGRISVMPGCGLTPANVGQVVSETKVTEVHAACRTQSVGNPAFSDFDPLAGRFETSADEVRAIKAQIS